MYMCIHALVYWLVINRIKVCVLKKNNIQWNLSIMVAHGPEINGCNREVTALKKCLEYMEFCRLGLNLSGCNKEVATLQSDHYTQV